MQLTTEFIHQHKTERGGWTKAQLEAIGQPWPPTPGWIRRATQRELTPARVEDFVRLREKTA